MSRDLLLYIDDILSSIDKIQRYTAGIDKEAFFKDEKTFEAAIFNLQVIGEAAKEIPDNYRKIYSQIEWQKVVGLRNIIVHSYFSLSNEVIWTVIQDKLPDLRDCILLLQNDLEQESEN
jgi:uncharacterized protein with HEPN domain